MPSQPFCDCTCYPHVCTFNTRKLACTCVCVCVCVLTYSLPSSVSMLYESSAAAWSCSSSISAVQSLGRIVPLRGERVHGLLSYQRVDFGW